MYPIVSISELEKNGDVQLLRGSGISKKDFNNMGKFPCIHYGDLYTLYTPIIQEVLRKTNVEGKIKSLEGDVLVPATTTADAMGIAIARAIDKEGVIIGGDINIIRTRNNVLLSSYLSYMINFPLKHQLAQYAKGVNILHLNNNDIRMLRIPVPPIQEQKSIVEKTTKLFANIDKVKANAEQNLNNAKELFESTLSNIFINLNFAPIKLCELADVCSGYAFKSNSFAEKGEYQVLRLGNVKQGFLRLSANPVYVNNVTNDILQKSLLKKGNAVITQTGTKNKRDYGFVAIVDKEGLLLNQRLAVVKFKETLLPQYFYYYSYTSTYKDDFFANEGGAVGQGNIGLNDIKSLTIPYISMSEQQKIVEKLDVLQEQTKQLEQIYAQKIKECDELKQSILQKAFRGEL